MAEAKETKPKTTAAAKKEPAAKPEAAPAAAAPQKDNTKKVVLIVVACVSIFIIIPMILVFVFAAVVGNKVLKENGVKVDGKSGNVTIKDKSGNEYSTGTQSLPGDFPKDVAVYKGTITSGGKLTTDGKTGWNVVVTTGDSPAMVSQALTNSFSTNGWTTSLNNSTNDGGLLIAKKDGLQTNIFYSTKDGKTSIVYTVANVGTTSDDQMTN